MDNTAVSNTEATVESSVDRLNSDLLDIRQIFNAANYNIIQEFDISSQEFAKQFGGEAERSYFSPGRVNLIGEHTDYNGGHVFPCAISLGTYAVVADRKDMTTRIYSMNLAD